MTGEEVRAALNDLHEKHKMNWREIALLDQFDGIPAGTLCAVAKGRDPKKASIRAALGLPPLAKIEVAPGIEIAEGAVLLRGSRPCACGCGGNLIPNSWNHRWLPGHRHVFAR